MSCEKKNCSQIGVHALESSELCALRNTREMRVAPSRL